MEISIKLSNQINIGLLTIVLLLIPFIFLKIISGIDDKINYLKTI